MSHSSIRLLRRSLFPSAVSVALHAGLMLLVLGITVQHLAPAPPERGPTLLELDSTPAPAPAPAQQTTPKPRAPFVTPRKADTRPDQGSPTAAPGNAESQDARDAASAALAQNSPLDTPPNFSIPIKAPEPVLARAPERPAASFAGLQSRAATRIVYVVDASGSMVHTLSFVLDELARSISRLQPTQSFQIVLFSKLPDQPGFRTPPIETDRRGLIRATPANRRAAHQWLGKVVAGGKSNPAEGLRAALDLHPGLIFMLARGIQRTGADPSQAGDVDAVLSQLDTINPYDTNTGLRPVVIKTIQFVDEDPTGLMQRIARIHGDGAGSYRLLRPESLGNAPPITNPDPLPEPIEHAIARAAGILTNIERDLTPLAVLTNVATREEISTTRDAANSALKILADAPPATNRTADGRAQLLRARAALLAAATETNRARRIDLARRAIADSAPLPIVDPETDAQRDITLALAQAMAGSADNAHDNLLALIRYRDDAELDDTTIARARLALVTTADTIDPRSPKSQRARDALIQTLHTDPRDQDVWPDPAWRALAAATLARSLAAANAPTDAALAPLLTQLDDRSMPIDHRRALIYPRIAVVARDLPSPPPEALRAMAEHASWTGRTDDAVLLFKSLADQSNDVSSRGEAIRSAAVLLDRRGDPGDAARARTLFLRFAAEQPENEDAAHALTLAFTQPGATPRQIETALKIAPGHALADRWRLKLASVRRGLAGLELLDHIDDPTYAAELLELELVDELLEGPKAGDRVLLTRAADLAGRPGAAMSDDRRIVLAQSLLDIDPARTIDTLSTIHAPAPNADRAGLLRIRAMLTLGRDAEAFTASRDLAARSEPDADDVFWEAATVWLELGSSRGGPEARAAARAHVARLRRLHPELGGEPWSHRLDAIAN